MTDVIDLTGAIKALEAGTADLESGMVSLTKGLNDFETAARQAMTGRPDAGFRTLHDSYWEHCRLLYMQPETQQRLKRTTLAVRAHVENVCALAIALDKFHCLVHWDPCPWQDSPRPEVYVTVRTYLKNSALTWCLHGLILATSASGAKLDT